MERWRKDEGTDNIAAMGQLDCLWGEDDRNAVLGNVAQGRDRDTRGAGRAIKGKDETKEWYAANKEKMVLHPETRAWVEDQLLGENP
jgi:hypothetical protein